MNYTERGNLCRKIDKNKPNKATWGGGKTQGGPFNPCNAIIVTSLDC